MICPVLLVLLSAARANKPLPLPDVWPDSVLRKDSAAVYQLCTCCLVAVFVQVSAEVATVSLEQPITLKKIHKSMDAEEGIRAAMQHCFLFTGTSLPAKWLYPIKAAALCCILAFLLL